MFYPRFRFRHHLIKQVGILLTCLIALALLFVSVYAQQPNGGLRLTRIAEPQNVSIGDETTITVTLTAQAAPPCANAPQSADIVLVIDSSDSMKDLGKLAAAQDAARQFVTATDFASDRIAIVRFNDAAELLHGLTDNRSELVQAIGVLAPSDGTDISAGLGAAIAELTSSRHRPGATSNIVLLSDGQSDLPAAQRTAQDARARGIFVYTISLGDDADQNLMRVLASEPKWHFHAPVPSQLTGIYDTVRRQIQHNTPQDINVQVTFDPEKLDLIVDSLAPAGTVSGNTLSWSVATLAPNQRAEFRFRARARQSGNFAASPSAQIEFTFCGASLSIDQGAAAQVNVDWLPRTCQENPISNDCVSQIACLGPMTLPCTTLGLPWWVCLLLALLALAALLLALRRKQHERSLAAPVPPVPPIPQPPEAPLIPPLPELPKPAPLVPIAPALNLGAPRRTFVIGLGEAGSGTIDSFKESLTQIYGVIPANVRCLKIENQSANADPDQLVISNARVESLSEELARSDEDLPYLRKWYSKESTDTPKQSSTQNDNSSKDENTEARRDSRLSLFQNVAEIQGRLTSELAQLQAQEGADTDIYLIGSLSDPFASGILTDVAHLTRAQLDKEHRAALYALLLLPDTQPNVFETFPPAFAAWRELNRFQSIFDYPYPIAYDDARQTIRQGKLFERCYLIGGERERGAALRNVNPEHGIYPALADAILAWMDTDLRRAWEQVARASDDQLGRLQTDRGETLYNSLGIFTYILPVADLEQWLANTLIHRWIETQIQNPKRFTREDIFRVLARAQSPDGVSHTRLVQDVPTLLRQDQKAAEQTADARGLQLTGLLAVHSESESTRAADTFLRAFAAENSTARVRTSDEMRAPDYTADTKRFLAQIDELDSLLEQGNLWFERCREGQAAVFERLLVQELGQHLNSDVAQSPHQRGLGVALQWLETLEEIFASYRQIIKPGLARRIQEHERAQNDMRSLRAELERAAQKTQARYPTLARAMLRGILPAMGLTIGLGITAVLAPGLSLALALSATIPVALGIYFTHRTLTHTPPLVRLQQDYRAAAQTWLAARAELKLYQTWDAVIAEWLTECQKMRAQLAQWQAVFAEPAQPLQTMLRQRATDIETRRAARQQIQVRKYLEDDKWQQEIGKQILNDKTINETHQRARWIWQDGNWRLILAATQYWNVDASDQEKVQAAWLDLAHGLVSPVRQMSLGSLLRELYAADSLAEEIFDTSAPFIQIRPDIQPFIQENRFVALLPDQQNAYWRQMLARLKAVSPRTLTQRLVSIANPYRAFAVTGMDLIRTEGIITWQRAKEAYTSTPPQQRANLYVFAAEQNAARFESELGRREKDPLLTPFVCATLEEAPRARAFWLAFLCGWIQEGAQRDGFTHRFAYQLKLPNREPIPLTEWMEHPTLEQAFADFTLRGRGPSSGEILTIWLRAIESSTAPLDKGLSEQVPEVQRLASHYAGDMGRVLRVIVLDELERLERGVGVLPDSTR